MAYRCLNCGHTSTDTRISADICNQASCGFRSGHWTTDDDTGYVPSTYDPEKRRAWCLSRLPFVLAGIAASLWVALSFPEVDLFGWAGVVVCGWFALALARDVLSAG